MKKSVNFASCSEKGEKLFISTLKGRLVGSQFNKQIDLIRSINYIFKIAWKKAVKFHVQIRIFTSHLLTRIECYCNLESTVVNRSLTTI